MSQKVNPVILCILDGWGYNPKAENNAIKLANSPVWNDLVKNNPHTFIRTDGEAVGLPKGQMGNSEVGHTNIGAGRVVYQDLPKISKAFDDHQVENIVTIKDTIEQAKANNSIVHIMGLCSDGGIHSHINHMLQATEIFAKNNINIKLHLFTDGRDTPPQSAIKYIDEVNELIKKYKNISIATVSGRYYAMDRDKRWDRIALAYNAIVLAKGQKFANAKDAVEAGYTKLIKENRIPSDEFIIPAVINGYMGMQNNDIIFMINFRSDRVRQLLTALLDPEFNEFKREKVYNFSKALAMVSYSTELDKLTSIVFPTNNLTNTLGEVVAKLGLKQLRTAETEKYPHVTFFFNGGREAPFEGEERILINSPKVATYDLQPEMSAYPLKDRLVKEIYNKKYSLIIINFANGDMVGHTGVLEATIKAVHAVTSCLKDIIKAAKDNDYTLLITADHGNSEIMWDEKNNAPHTQHSTNPVMLIVYNPPKNKNINSLTEGILADIAPTILDIMGLDKPKEMTGKSLIT